jgi:hypothetical protein
MINAPWHRTHRMPPRASLDERVAWHLAHAWACGCRDIPDTVRRELARRGVKPPLRRRARRARVGGRAS